MSKYLPRILVVALFLGIVLWMTLFLNSYFEKKATVKRSLTVYQKLIDEAREHSSSVDGWYEYPKTVKLFVEKLEKVDVSSAPIKFQQIFARNVAVWRRIKSLYPVKTILEEAEDLAMTDGEHFHQENQRVMALIELRKSNEELQEFAKKCGVNMDAIMLRATPPHFSNHILSMEN